MFREQYSKAQIDEILKGFSLKETARAEELDVETLVRLANTFAKSP
jgi:16S rRNA A1518/A1519 N6-dimethyltransferase RsmA/KsgA/DIM1 with predicted DNA glycosylase/AP lyase activity